MSSTRRQDYGHALYELAEVFPEFLAHAAVVALQAAMTVLETYVAEAYPFSAEEAVEGFDFPAREARVRGDHSAIWDSGELHGDGEPIRMLHEVERHLERVAEREDARPRLRDLVDVVVGASRLAVVWRRRLRVGARFPDTLGVEILPLAWAAPLIAGHDTRQEAGEFVQAVLPRLSPVERERIERAIVAISDRHLGGRREAGRDTRDCLLGCLAEDRLVTDEARTLITALRSAGGAACGPDWPPVAVERARTLAHVTDRIGGEIYFASGACARGREDRRLTPEESARFYRETGELLDELTDLGMASLAHHLVQTLEAFISLGPRGVFLRLAQVVRGGRRDGYQDESMAVDLS